MIGHICECKICEKQVIVRTERIGQKGNKKTKSKQMVTSKDGVYFSEGRAWFCNKCWELVLGKKETKKRKQKRGNKKDENT